MAGIPARVLLACRSCRAPASTLRMPRRALAQQAAIARQASIAEAPGPATAAPTCTSPPPGVTTFRATAAQLPSGGNARVTIRTGVLVSAKAIVLVVTMRLVTVSMATAPRALRSKRSKRRYSWQASCAIRARQQRGVRYEVGAPMPATRVALRLVIFIGTAWRETLEAQNVRGTECIATAGE